MHTHEAYCGPYFFQRGATVLNLNKAAKERIWTEDKSAYFEVLDFIRNEFFAEFFMQDFDDDGIPYYREYFAGKRITGMTVEETVEKGNSSADDAETRLKMIIHIGKYVLDVDVEATRQSYMALPLITESCGCELCENYFTATDKFPDVVIQLFESLGVDVRRAAEVFGICCEDKTEFSYGGFYHIVGKIVSQKESLYFQVSEKVWKQNPEMVVSVTDKFLIWFTEECSLVPDGFPEQRLQMEISFDIPWALERPYWEVDMSPRQWKRIQEGEAVLIAKKKARRDSEKRSTNSFFGLTLNRYFYMAERYSMIFMNPAGKGHFICRETAYQH